MRDKGEVCDALLSRCIYSCIQRKSERYISQAQYPLYDNRIVICNKFLLYDQRLKAKEFYSLK